MISASLLTLLLAAIIVACHAVAIKNDIFFHEDRVRNDHPILSGFIEVNNQVLRIMKRINLRSSCLRMEFVGIPANTSSPIVGGNSFTLVKHNLYNGRFGWTNGPDYVSYFPSTGPDSPFGTWMLNNNPEVDSGFAFIKPLQDTLVASDSGMEWNWLENGQWMKSNTIQLVCQDKFSTTGHFYHVEYFTNGEAQTGFYAPRLLSPDDYRSIIDAKAIEDFDLLRFMTRPALWNDKRKDLMNPTSETNFAVIAKFGSGTLLMDSNGRQTIGHLINTEHLNGGWSITFRREVGTAFQERKSKWNNEMEVNLYLNFDTAEKDMMRPMSGPQEILYMAYAHKSLASVKKGDYINIWYNKLYKQKSESLNVGVDGSGIVQGGEVGRKVDVVEEELEVLLECVGRSDSILLFKYYLSDRRDAMRQSIISKEAQYFTYSYGQSGQVLMTDAAGSEIAVTSYSFIGSDAIGYIRKYLDYKDNVAGGLPSCYFYHAAVTLPKALIYAAEIVCVLTGAKPITLVQFSTPTDHQWKFPLVSELCHSIVRTKLLMGSAFDVEYKTFKYRNDESLVFYRTNRTYVADSLIPLYESQALHPVPYPNDANPRPDWDMQIYNAWWNGYMLGYPERFVTVYCESFHNGLTLEEKRVQIQLARVDALDYMKVIDLPVAEIRTGLEPPVSKASWNNVMSHL